jgi:hypothetical protein
MRGAKALQDLDNYLRGIWLDCCGHLSEFNVGYFESTIGKQRKVSEVFKNKDAQILHLYDMGTTSETVVRVMGVREGKPLTARPLVLMARNQAPEFPCMDCGKPAVLICMECVYEDGADGTLCQTHAKKHPHNNYGEPMPLVNSPRVGMCGYNGPADPPY